MRIVIETIAHEKQRYPTVGDWQFAPDGTLRISVSETDDDRFNLLVAVHELVEAKLCQAGGVTQDAVDAFDLAHSDLDEPGEHPLAPYRQQHAVATGIEVELSQALGVDWEAYEAALVAL